MKQYTIRKCVLNMSIDQWKTYKDIAFDCETITISPKEAKRNFGLIGMLTAKANHEEIEFIKELYKI